MQLQRLAQRELECLLRPRGERDMPAHRPFAGTNDCPHRFARPVTGDAEALERLERDAAGFAEQPEQHMLSADVVMLQQPGFLLGKDDDMPGAVSESLKHATMLSQASDPVNTMLIIWSRSPPAPRDARIGHRGLGRPPRRVGT